MRLHVGERENTSEIGRLQGLKELIDHDHLRGCAKLCVAELREFASFAGRRRRQADGHKNLETSERCQAIESA